MNIARTLAVTAAAVLLSSAPSGAGLWDSLKQAVGGMTGTTTSGTSGLASEEIAAGLREALKVGTERAVAQASTVGGFLDNPQIRIPLPEKLNTAGRLLRTFGMGSQVDAFEETMNRAAEQAAGKALPIFGDAVAALTFQDVQQIWKGGDTAATEYLDRTTRNRLFGEFQPVVHAAGQQVGVTQAYQNLTGRPEISAVIAGTDLDLDHYVTGKALDGLFTILAAEEKKIRTDPVSRTTDLLQKVFSQ